MPFCEDSVPHPRSSAERSSPCLGEAVVHLRVLGAAASVTAHLRSLFKVSRDTKVCPTAYVSLLDHRCCRSSQCCFVSGGRSQSSSYEALRLHPMQIRVEGSEIRLLTTRRRRLPAAGLFGVSAQPEGKRHDHHRGRDNDMHKQHADEY